MATPRRRKKTAGEQQLEYKIFRVARVCDTVAQVLRSLFTWAGIAATAWFLNAAAGHLAGKSTGVDVSAGVDVSLVASEHFTEIVSILFGSGSITWALVERWLRRRTIKQLSGRTRELEKALDARRSSSGLRADGTTPPEDDL